MDRDPVEVVRAYWERLWNDAALDAVKEVISDRYLRHTASGSMQRTHAQVREDLMRYHRVLYRPDITIDDQAVAGGTVWTRLTLRGLNVETEENVVLSWLHVARVVDGRIAEAWSLSAPVDWTTPPRSA